MRAIVLLFPESRTSTSLNGESVVLASASSKGSKRIWSELGAFEMTFFILSINIASVGTVLYTYLLIEGENEGKKNGQEFFGESMAWRGRTGTKPFQSHRAVGKLSPYIFLTTSRKVQTLEPLPPSRLPSSDRYDYR